MAAGWIGQGRQGLNGADGVSCGKAGVGCESVAGILFNCGAEIHQVVTAGFAEVNPMARPRRDIAIYLELDHGSVPIGGGQQSRGPE
jgi:hypothetical protein